MEKEEDKLDSVSYTSNLTPPPLFDTEPPPPLVRNFTIPTPESSPSSCTSDVLHPHHLHASAHLNMGLEGVRYTLPTPDVSPMDGQGRPLEYPNYQLHSHERFNFEAAPLPGFMSGYGGTDGGYGSWGKMEHYDPGYNVHQTSLESTSQYHLQRDVVLCPDQDSLSSALAGLRENYYDYNMAKHPEI